MDEIAALTDEGLERNLATALGELDDIGERMYALALEEAVLREEIKHLEHEWYERYPNGHPDNAKWVDHQEIRTGV